MKKPIYQINRSVDCYLHEFFSEGPKGKIRKRVVFQQTDNPVLYNFAFGDVNEVDEIDDLAETNNGDFAVGYGYGGKYVVQFFCSISQLRRNFRG